MKLLFLLLIAFGRRAKMLANGFCRLPTGNEELLASRQLSFRTDSRKPVLLRMFGDGSLHAVSRKQFLLSFFLPSVGVSLSPGRVEHISQSIEEARNIIQSSCDRRYLYAVISSGYKFLYRGIPRINEQPFSKVSVRREPCDLLTPNTYDDPEAVQFFRGLEQILKDINSPIKPSNGHLATTSVNAAKKWGTAASIWPLGEGVHYAWFDSGGLFWPRDESLCEMHEMLVIDGRNCGQVDLEDALRKEDTEILFQAFPFLAVPQCLDVDLRESLRSLYTL